MSERPTGTVTFLFTDIEGSTRLWQDQPEAMKAALERHDSLLRQTIEANGGYVFKTVGDAFCTAFESAVSAVNAVLAIQLALNEEQWPGKAKIRVRSALHTGETESRDGDYFGIALSRVGRLLSAGHGGQILLSQSTQLLVEDALPKGTALRPMGTHRLRDLSRLEDVFQLDHKDLEGEFPALQTLDNLPNNLPRQLTSFIGREKELEELKELFAKTSLLTLTGVGGTGKTRLALQFAGDQLRRFKDGVWLIELAALTDPDLVANEVANALSLKEESGKTMTETLVAKLKERRMLLVLDNCEHLLKACTDLTARLLRSCPKIKILTTSREALGVGGELAYQVPSLAVPDEGTKPSDVSGYAAVRLFSERAMFARPGFSIDESNAGAVAAVCTRLDGIPLAIELAAARVKAMSVAQVIERLDQKFRLLTGGSKSALKRQQTLQGLIDWSYDLLDKKEQALLQRISVFRGGWTLAAAEKTCPGGVIVESHVLDLLTSLVEKSLVVYQNERYRMLETVRDYATDRLAQESDPPRWRDGHLAFYLGLAEEAEVGLTGKEQAAWLDRLETEYDNLRAAMDWASAGPDAANAQLRTAGLLWQYWFVRGYSSEGRERLVSVIKRSAEPTEDRARALHGAGYLCWSQSDYGPAAEYLEEALSIRRALGDKRATASSLNGLGIVAYLECDYPLARRHYEESLAISREIGDRAGTAKGLNNLGNVARQQGDLATTRKLQEESLAIVQELGDQHAVAVALGNLGLNACEAGDYAEARKLQQRSLAIRRELGDRDGVALALNNLGDVAYELRDYVAARRFQEESIAVKLEINSPRGVAESLEALATLMSAETRLDDAAHTWGAAEALRERIASPLPPNQREQYDRQVAAGREAMDDDEAFDAAWQEGRGMSMEEAVELALRETGGE